MTRHEEYLRDRAELLEKLRKVSALEELSYQLVFGRKEGEPMNLKLIDRVTTQLSIAMSSALRSAASLAGIGFGEYKATEADIAKAFESFKEEVQP